MTSAFEVTRKAGYRPRMLRRARARKGASSLLETKLPRIVSGNRDVWARESTARCPGPT